MKDVYTSQANSCVIPIHLLDKALMDATKAIAWAARDSRTHCRVMVDYRDGTKWSSLMTVLSSDSYHPQSLAGAEIQVLSEAVRTDGNLLAYTEPLCEHAFARIRVMDDYAAVIIDPVVGLTNNPREIEQAFLRYAR